MFKADFAFNLFRAIHSSFPLNTFSQNNLPLIKWQLQVPLQLPASYTRDFFNWIYEAKKFLQFLMLQTYSLRVAPCMFTLKRIIF